MSVAGCDRGDRERHLREELGPGRGGRVRQFDRPLRRCHHGCGVARVEARAYGVRVPDDGVLRFLRLLGCVDQEPVAVLDRAAPHRDLSAEIRRVRPAGLGQQSQRSFGIPGQPCCVGCGDDQPGSLLL